MRDLGGSTASDGGSSNAGGSGLGTAGSGFGHRRQRRFGHRRQRALFSGGGRPSMGCGAATSPKSGRYTITSGGAQRAYELDLPSGYDSTVTHRLFFSWYWNGGTAKRI